MTNTALLKEAIRKSGYKKAFLAEKVGLSCSGFWNCVNGRAEFRASHISVLCELLGLTDLDEINAIFFAQSGG